VNVPVVAPAFTDIDGGTEATFELVEAKAIFMPEFGAAFVRVTVPVEIPSPKDGFGVIVILEIFCAKHGFMIDARNKITARCSFLVMIE